MLHAVTECDGEQLAAMQGHIQRLGFTATMRLKEAQAARLMQLLGEYVVGDGDDVVVGGGGAGKKSVEATRGDSADDTQHTLSSTTEASQRSQTKPHITIDDVIRVLSGFTAGSTTPTKPTTFMDDHLNVALPHLIQHANGKNIADLLREVVVLKVQLSVEVQHVLGGAITKHVGEMGAASMSKVVSALSTRRCVGGEEGVVYGVVLAVGRVVLIVLYTCTASNAPTCTSTPSPLSHHTPPLTHPHTITGT